MAEEKITGEIALSTLLFTFRALLDALRILVLRKTSTRAASRSEDPSSQELEFVVVSMVPWDYLWQRNHHTMARLSKRWKVLYCCPIPTITAAKEGTSSMDLEGGKYGENLLHYRPLVLWGDSRVPLLRRLNRLLLRNSLLWHAMLNGMGSAMRILWFYFPTYGDIAGRLGEDLVMYDIQDEYSAFDWFPPDTPLLERKLIGRCDLVLTGTLQLWKRKREYNPNTHFVQCGVESGHFSRARDDEVQVPPDMAELPKPIFGYFGLVDSRVDLPMLEEVATRKPDWTIVLIGPAHISTELPNIFLPGRREYTDLPAYLKAFDVCLIPFVMNDNTRNLNPTKLLEYFASGKPVISAPIPDVVELYPRLVEIAGTADEFIASAGRLLAEPDDDLRALRIREAEENSWEGMVQTMVAHIQRTMEERNR